MPDTAHAPLADRARLDDAPTDATRTPTTHDHAPLADHTRPDDAPANAARPPTTHGHAPLLAAAPEDAMSATAQDHALLLAAADMLANVARSPIAHAPLADHTRTDDAPANAARPLNTRALLLATAPEVAHA
ncbi:hypothetical protein ABZ345_08685 [Lentzea sp. NPDC005914]|uniref:hypothetical protein n=1 Tax=Lentzea sp. NPDC005914 TaxID=3154572 RepID=UPI0033C66AAB